MNRFNRPIFKQPILWRAGLRYHFKHPWQFFLAVIGIALGVAMVVAIDLANVSAQQAFTHATQTLSGKATHRIIAGPSGRLAERIFVALHRHIPHIKLAPFIEGYAIAEQHANYTFHIVGIDPFFESAFREFGADVGGQTNLVRLLTEPNTVLIEKTLAQQLSIIQNTELELSIAGQPQVVSIAGYIQLNQGTDAQSLQNILLADIAVAQTLLQQQGYLTHIDLVLPDREIEATVQKIKTYLPPTVQLIAVNQANSSLNQMTQAFRINLTAMSLLALLVGMFLIYNTMTFAIVQRRTSIGMLRTLGVQAREIGWMILGEAVIVGLLGTVLGLILGILLGNGLLSLVVRTINSLYVSVQATELYLQPLVIAKALALGVGATVIAALVPIREAATTSPRVVMSRSHSEQHLLRQAPRLAIIGAGLIIAALILMGMVTSSLVLSFLLLFIIVIGYALLTPYSVVTLGHCLQGWMTRGFKLLGTLAMRGILRNLSRTAIAIIALTVAVATTIGMSTMVGSFRGAVTQWISNSLSADIYISFPNAGAPTVSDNDQLIALKQSFNQVLTDLDFVDTMSIGLWAKLTTEQGSIKLLVLDLPPQGFDGFVLKEKNHDTRYETYQNQDTILISEPYAYHHQLTLGDQVTLPTAKGEQTFTVIGIYYDYGSDQGVISMSRHTYLKYWDDDRISSFGIYLQPKIEVEVAIEQIRQALNQAQGDKTLPLMIRSTESIKEITIKVFDQTFAITDVLRILTIIVAVVGIFCALMALQIERAREFAILRTHGLLPRELWQLVSLETVLMGAFAGLLAIPLGLLLSAILIEVINQRSFGWSMAMSVNPYDILLSFGLAVIAAFLAGLYPVARMVRTQPGPALREE